MYVGRFNGLPIYDIKSEKMVKVYRSFIRIVIQAIRYSGGYTGQFAGDGIMGVFQDSNEGDQIILSSCKAIKQPDIFILWLIIA